MRPGREFPRQVDQARQRARRLHHRHAAATPEGIAALEGDDEVEALVQDAGKRVRRVESQRAQDRQQLMLEIIPHPGFLFRAPFGAPHEAYLLAIELGDEDLVEHAVLFRDQPVGGLGDAVEHLLGREIVRAGLHRTRGHLLHQARHADLEELIEVGDGDAQETQPFEQG